LRIKLEYFPGGENISSLKVICKKNRHLETGGLMAIVILEELGI
jgi:hypothetical protein